MNNDQKNVKKAEIAVKEILDETSRKRKMYLKLLSDEELDVLEILAKKSSIAIRK